MRFFPGLRRLLHAVSPALLLLVPLGGLALLRWTLVAAIAVAAAIEALRLSRARVNAVLACAVPAFRPVESRRPTGATWLAVGYAISAWLPPPGPQAGLLVGGLADPAASLVGSRWGHGGERGRENGGKTAVGTLGFAAVAVVVLLVLGLRPTAVALVAVAGALVERFSGPIDDNVLVPPVAGLVAVLVG